MSVNEEKWLAMHVHVQLRLDDSGGSCVFGGTISACDSAQAVHGTSCQKHKGDGLAFGMKRIQAVHNIGKPTKQP